MALQILKLSFDMLQAHGMRSFTIETVTALLISWNLSDWLRTSVQRDISRINEPYVQLFTAFKCLYSTMKMTVNLTSSYYVASDLQSNKDG